MPGCCVPECRNRSEGGYRLFSVPTAKNDDQRRKVWLDYINRRELKTRASICEVHFNDDQFEMNRKDNRKLLKKSAVPTRSLKRKRINDEPSAKVISSKQGNMSSIMSTIYVVGCSEEVAEINKSESNESYVTNEQFQRLQNKLKAAEVRINALQTHVKILEAQCKTIFTEDQVHMLKYGNHKGHQWSDETVKKSLKLYIACGTKGYEEILSQKLPYPSIRTLQNRIQNSKLSR